MARSTAYKQEYNEQAYKLCLLGAIDKDLADFFEVCEATINNWKIDFPEFLESIRAGKVLADMQVANNLFKSTGDRVVEERKPFKLRNVYYDSNGKKIEEEKIEMVVEERVIPADFKSQSLWLRNRRPDLWKEKQEVDLKNNGESFNNESDMLKIVATIDNLSKKNPNE